MLLTNLCTKDSAVA